MIIKGLGGIQSDLAAVNQGSDHQWNCGKPNAELPFRGEKAEKSNHKRYSERQSAYCNSTQVYQEPWTWSAGQKAVKVHISLSAKMNRLFTRGKSPLIETSQDRSFQVKGGP